MTSTLKAMRALSDPTRLRILALIAQEELSVHELQEITGLGQSRISTHLRQLLEPGLILSRREGKHAFYRVADLDGTVAELLPIGLSGAEELDEHEGDRVNLRRIVKRRTQEAEVYFNQVAGRFDRVYGPGRSWQAFGHLLLRILPPLEVADLGAGEGLLSELLARRCKKVIAVDNSERIVAFGARKAKENKLKNLEFRLGDLEEPPIKPNSVDLVVLSQALHHSRRPERALRSAFKILRPGGQVMILDLLEHRFQHAKELYGDLRLGFAASDLQRWLEESGFTNVDISRVAKEEDPPHFETILASGEKR